MHGSDGSHARLSSVGEIERRECCRGMRSGVVGELEVHEEQIPIGLMMIYKTTKHLFNFAINDFGLTISLRMMGR